LGKYNKNTLRVLGGVEMKYLGIARKEKDQILVPDALKELIKDEHYEVVEIGGDILLIPSPIKRERLVRIERLARDSIRDHRKALEELAR